MQEYSGLRGITVHEGLKQKVARRGEEIRNLGRNN